MSTVTYLIIGGGALLIGYYLYKQTRVKETPTTTEREQKITSSDYEPEPITPETAETESIEAQVKGTLPLSQEVTTTEQVKNEKKSVLEQEKRETPRQGTPITEIKGINSTYTEKLKETGITTVETLLEEGATRTNRKELAETTGTTQKNILEWVNQADLYRVKGVAEEYAELLKEAGVNTVPELAQRNPENLHNKLLEVNEEEKLVNRAPSLKEVENWINQAKKMPRKIEY